MSKRNLLLLALGAFLLPLIAGAALLLLYPEYSPFGDPTYTDEIPEKRPRRPDRRLLERHAGKPIAEVLAAAKAEREAASAKEPAPDPAASQPPALLAMLPEAPLPFPAGAAPRDEEGLKRFVTGLKASPESGPSTAEERWQLNLALAALGAKPEDVPEAIRLETRPAPESDTFPVRLAARPSELRGPLVLGDFDGEDGPEIVASGGAALFKPDPGGDPVALDGLSGTEPGDSLHPIDYDGDGALDLFVARGGGLPDSLLRNEGGGRFADLTIALGLLAFGDTTAVAWLDYDQDGLPDLLVGSRDRPLELYRQTEAGLFQPVAWDLKLWVPRGVAALAAADVDGDGFPDLFVAREDGRNQLFLSRPAELWSDWRFAEAEDAFGFPSGAPVSVARFFDFDNDARPDLLLATAESGVGGARLYHNLGEGRFDDVTAAAGLELDAGVLSAAVADLDLDGYEDLVLGTAALSPDRVFSNQGGSGFREVTVAAGGGWLDETLAWTVGDLGGDGGVHLFATKRDGSVRRLEAEGGEGAWLRVAAPGQPPGTRLLVSVRDRDWVVHTFQRRFGVEPVLTLGLGGGETVERLEIYDATGAEALKTLEKIEPERLVVVELPTRPAKRALVPIAAPEE